MDKNSNYVLVTYDEDIVDGTQRVTKIAYTGNETASLTPQRSVQFFYEDRTDDTAQYIAGVPIIQDQRLSSIQTYVGDALIKSYNLAYDYSVNTNSSLLQTVQECDGDGNCMNPTSFAWQNTGGENNFTLKNWTQAGKWGSYFTEAADFNGDGLADIASAGSATELYVYLSTGDGFTETTLDNTFLALGDTWAVDVNGDGLDDIVSPSGGNIHVYLSTGDGFKNNIWTIDDVAWGDGRYVWAADFNGDGLADIAAAVGTDIYVYLSTGGGFYKRNLDGWGNLGRCRLCLGGRF